MAVLAASTAGCASDRDAAASADPAPKRTVTVQGDAYVPATVHIRTGGRVTWVNRDAEVVTVETDGVGFFEYDRDKLRRQRKLDLHTLSVGEAESIAFDAPGRYRYHSSYDETMQGTVIVTAPDPGR